MWEKILQHQLQHLSKMLIHFALNGPVYILTSSPDSNTGSQPLYLAIGNWVGNEYAWGKLYGIYRPVGERGRRRGKAKDTNFTQGGGSRRRGLGVYTRGWRSTEARLPV